MVSMLQGRRDAADGSPLNPRLTTRSFIRTSNNAMACNAVDSVAVYLGVRPLPNPLYIYGEEGLGKTHLAQALAQALAANGHRAPYFTSELFKQEYLRPSRFDTPISQALRKARCIIIDDLQDTLPSVQNLNVDIALKALLDASYQQVVVMAKRLPHDFPLSADVRSRFSRGLVIEIRAMDAELRGAILDRHIARVKEAYPAFALLEGIKERIAGNRGLNGRHLEGIVNRLIAEYSVSGGPASFEAVEMVMAAIVGTAGLRRITIEEIQCRVAEHYNIRSTEMQSSRRARIVSRPRQVAMYLSKQLTPRTLTEIGRKFGGRDHTTIIHSIKRIEELMADAQFRDEVLMLRRQLEG